MSTLLLLLILVVSAIAGGLINLSAMQRFTRDREPSTWWGLSWLIPFTVIYVPLVFAFDRAGWL